ncbi:MAG: septum formation protein Maf [Desulfuromonas sp.]|nr:MAG: septum formation protein Maf [Desulfuromonas sp.]
MRKIVLASTSPYRRKLLQQLDFPFSVATPRYIEEMDQGVAPELLVKHLSFRKAESLKRNYPDALIIGSDQVFVDPRGRILGKPAGRDAAILQLKAMVGQKHTFYTGVSVFDAQCGEVASDCATYAVTLRNLSDEQIASYVDREKPFDCAGSFRVEGLGIALMEKMEGEDYNALIGLPLIKLTELLERFDVALL